uniref:CsbD family protein n=1 Tax=Cyanothece sp. (strain PCC 7425 / ATCC 29141) TaxID=395961 RepID=B8HP09_CYAP4
MSLEERAKATAKNIEGKAQEMLGNVTGNPEDQLKGQAKQVESAARHTKEDLKDEIKRGVDQA